MTEPYGVGTVTVANGGTVVTGVGTGWVGKVRKNDLFTDPAQGLMARVTADPTENDELAINPWPGVALSGDAYEIIPSAAGIDISGRLRELLFGLSLVDPNFDAQVNTLPDRATYDDRQGPTPTARGFAVLVSDIGDGSSAIYSKLSNALAEWSEAAPYSGPSGDKGWSAVYALVPDGARRVEQLTSWVGGEGDTPTFGIGKYRGPGGLVDNIADATDVRGAPGLDGTGAGTVIGPEESGPLRLVLFSDASGTRIDDSGRTIDSVTSRSPAAIYDATPAATAAQNTSRLNAAFVAVKAGSKQLDLASGIYPIDGTVTISSSLKLEGNGPRASMIALNVALDSGSAAVAVQMSAGEGQHYSGLRFRDFGIIAPAANADVGLQVKLASGAFLSNFEFDSINVGEFRSWGMTLDNSAGNTDGFFVGSIRRCSFTNGFHGPKIGDSINFEWNQCHAGEGVGGGNTSIRVTGVPGARQYVFACNNLTCRGGALIAEATDQLRLINNQCEHSWWTGDGAYTNPAGYDGHVVVKDSLQPIISGNTMNGFPSFSLPISITSGRFDNGSPTITLMDPVEVAKVQVGDSVTNPDGLLGGVTRTVLSKTSTSITLNGNAISTAVAGVVVTRLKNPNGAAATLKLMNCNEALVEDNDIAAGRLHHIEIDANCKNTRIGRNRYYSNLSPTILDNGQGTMGVKKSPTLINGWAAFTGPSDPLGPQFEKGLDGRVRLRGSIQGGAIGTYAFVLPVGFRPESTARLPVYSNSGSGQVGGSVIVLSDGSVQVYAGNNIIVQLDSVNFDAPPVA